MKENLSYHVLSNGTTKHASFVFELEEIKYFELNILIPFNDLGKKLMNEYYVRKHIHEEISVLRIHGKERISCNEVETF